ncbi:MAG: PAS domain S-box protein, partial [candidate division KSB1 bacterium]|nr:PAS domain S-box protein [candidate division KSB1 bacterium]
YLQPEPQQTTNLMLLIVGAGFFILSARWLAFIIAATFAGWAYLVSISPPATRWLHFGFGLLSATVLAALVHFVRVRTLRRLEWLLIQDQRRKTELESALALTATAHQMAEAAKRHLETAVQAAQQSEDRFRRLSEATFEGIVVHDNGKILDVNQAAAKMFGHDPSEVIGRQVLEFVAPESRELVLKNISTEYEKPYEAIGLRKDRSTFPIEICGKSIAYQGRTVRVGAIRDLTVHKRTDEALRESEERFRDLFESSPDAIFVEDLDGNVLDVNPAACRLHGVAREALLGKSVFELVPPDKKDQVAVDFRKLTRGESDHVEGFSWTASGQAVPVEIRASRIHYAGRAAVLLHVRDITERRRAEEQLKTSIKEKEILLKEIQHRVKNNLQIISSLLNLQSGFVKDKKALAMFTELDSRIQSMAMIHEKFFHATAVAKIDFAEYVGDLTRYLFRIFGVNPETIRLKLHVDHVLLGIDTAIPCGLIIHELVSNALKHAFSPNQTGEICIALGSNENDGFVLRVSDNGAGLPKDFDFRHTQSLGLQLVHTLTDQLGGTLEIHRNGGTVFKILFRA